MNKNNISLIRKPMAVILFAAGVALLGFALYNGSQQSAIPGWTPVNEPLQQALDRLALPSDKEELSEAVRVDPPASLPSPEIVTASPDAVDSAVGETSPEPSPIADASPSDPGKLDLNKATQADLEALPGIGPSKAKAILSHRDKIGGFRRVEQLLDVKGIGPKMFERLSPLVSVPANKS